MPANPNNPAQKQALPFKCRAGWLAIYASVQATESLGLDERFRYSIGHRAIGWMEVVRRRTGTEFFSFLW